MKQRLALGWTTIPIPRTKMAPRASSRSPRDAFCFFVFFWLGVSLSLASRLGNEQGLAMMEVLFWGSLWFSAGILGLRHFTGLVAGGKREGEGEGGEIGRSEHGQISRARTSKAGAEGITDTDFKLSMAGSATGREMGESANGDLSLGPPAIGANFYRFFFAWEGSPTKIDYSKKGTLILTSLLEDLGLAVLTAIWVGSLDFNFWEIKGFSIKSAKSYAFCRGVNSHQVV